MEENTTPNIIEEKQTNRLPLFGHQTGIIDYTSIALSVGLFVCSQLVVVPWCRWLMILSSCLFIIAPAIIQRIIVTNRFGISSIYRQFKKMGQNPSLDGNEIKWNFQGKLNVIRLGNGNQLQILREYPVQDDIVPKFARAASVTMSEVFSAKVGVKKDEDSDNSIYFSTEMLCSSIKEFTKLLPETVGILDAAEDRQRENLQVIVSAEMESQNTKRHRIGFFIGDDCKKSNSESIKD